MTDQAKPGNNDHPNQTNDDQEETTTKKWPREEDFSDEEAPVSDEVPEPEVEVGALEAPTVGNLEEKLTEMEQKVHEHWNETMRARAEMENVRQRADRDISNARKFALEKFIVELLPVVDSLEMGLQNKVEGDNMAAKVFEGMALTRDKMLSILEKFGVEQLDPEGETFDPSHHEAVSTQPAEGVKPNTVIAVMQKGYTLNDRLIRPAMVVVAK